MPLREAQFEQQLASETLAPSWLIASSEPLLLLEAADALRAKARERGYAEREVFEADNRFDWGALEASFAALSLFAQRRVIEVRLPTGKPGKEGAEILERFAKDPAPDVLLLVTAAEWSNKHDAAWSRAIDQRGAMLVLWPVKPNELSQWIARRLRSRGLGAAPEAAQLLAERVEGNLLAAAQEVDKLALLKGKGGGRSPQPASHDMGASMDVIGVEEMEALVADSARYDVFRLTDTALAGDAPRALHMLAGLRGEGEAVVPMLAWITSQVQALALLSAVQESGGNLAQAFNQARVWDSKQPLFRRALQRGSAAHFERLLSDCARIDRISKGRLAGDAWRELERVIVGIGAPRALR
jgi:DNA polymerase-3 subunit delta